MSDWDCPCDQCNNRLGPPEPCEYCWIVSGVNGHYRWQGKPLIRKGGKP